MGTLNCGACEIELFQNEDLFIYRPVKNEQHLAIKFERTDAVLNESAKFKLYPISRDSDVKMIKSAVVKCTNCNNPVAFRIHCGPNHDSLLCISMKTTFNVLADGSRLTNSSCGGGPLRKKILEQFLEERDITEFYGTQIKTIKSDSLVGSLTHPSIEDLIKLELEMNSLVKDKPRSYQVECFCAAAMFPSIIQIPTGSGKTHVSAMLTALYKRLNPNRMVWFLTDRIPLVFQQARYIEEQTSLTVLPLAGDVQTSLKPSQLIKYDVMVCTVQLLINMLVIGQIRIDDVSLIIIDEIHHAVKNHPYVIFIETFLSSRIGNDRPRLLGLTASPASGNPIQMKLQLRDLSRLCGAQLYTPCIYRNDLASAVNRPKTKFIPVDLTSGDSALSQLLFDNIRELLIDESCPCSNLEDVRNNLRGLTVKSRQDHLLSAKLYKVHHFLTALEMTSILGSRYSQSYVIDLLKYGGIDENLTPLEEKVLQMCRDEEKTTISPKVRALCKILESIDLVAAPETRMIVFVETKRTARWLASFLQEHLTNSGLNEWNPTAFTGQASNTVEGMNWIDEQRPILALFRSGHIKLLVATSVLQEGLDVAACNHIVLFDRTWSLKAFLQSRGRARAQDSEYTIICSADDENYYEKLFKQEIILSKMVRDEMVDAKVLSLELVMTTIHLNVKCGKLQFATAKLSAEDDGNGIFNTPLEAQENSLEEDEDGGDEYNLTVNVHNAQTETFDEPCQLNIIGIEWKRDHLLFFADKEEISVIIELPAILLKSIRRSWIQSTEELLDPLIRERFPDALIELDKLIPDLLIGFNNVPLFNSIVMELQKLAVGLLDSGNKFIETASQHHSFTPSMSQIIFEPLSRKINVIFQESLDEMTTTFRIEISFDTIDSFCLLARNCSSNEEENGDNNYDDSNFSLILPLKTPPLLFMATEEISKFEIEKKIDEIYWERVTANSFSSRLSEVFSSCPAIKFDLFLNGMTSRKLFQILLKFGVNILYTCNLEVDCFPEFHSLWLMKIEKFFKYLDFETQYRLRAIISETWSRTSLRITSEWLERASKVSQGTLELFNKKLARNRFVDLLECLKSCEALKLPQKDKLIPNNNVQGSLSVKLITWTPSRILLHNPTLFLSNRVLRHFGPDHFIRVHFRDEDFIKLSTIRSNASIENLLHVGVKGILDNGITIGNKKFEFLAMSSSQLRGHGCWFVDSEIGADNIRSWLGTFNDINNVAKYVARLGQSFSASRPTLSVSTFASVPDWKANDFCFSDGCGMIPHQLAQEIALKLNLSQVPAAFQIRFAGFKGVVAVNPEIKELSLRLSMKKFDSTHPSLDVLNIAEAFPCYLNRQVIMILSALGVPDSAFEKLQMNHLKYLAECFNSNGTLSLKDLNISDLDPRDPFMRSLISSQYRQQLTDLLTKSRIIVPKGRIIMGVIDETGILAEDEIFCQIRDDQMNKVVEGKVTVAKNPCMHPGDVRVLKAIRDPVLESYSYNVIVFSRNGPRPVPNMCSGSDLDGDLYFVTWDESLIPPQVDEPMDYDDGLSAKVKSGPITVEDLREFMVFFIENDKLGAIANTHVAFADQLEAGVRDPACKALAKLFSYAVDFAKTGYVASIPKEVRVEKFPDFMMKSHKPSYASHRIIGTLFREIKAIINEDVSDDFSGNILVNSEFLTPGYEVYLEHSRRLYEEYAIDIGQCLTQYGFRMESHLLMNCTMEVDISIREMHSDALEIAQLTFKHHVIRYREIFESFTGGNEEIANKLASAWYYVAYSDPIQPVGLDAPILSFPWIINSRPAYPRNSNVSLKNLIAQDIKNWFSDEAISLIDILSHKLSLLNSLERVLDNSKIQICLREFLLTGSIVLVISTSSNNLKAKILKEFPAALIKSTEDSLVVTVDSTTFTFKSEVNERRAEFSNPAVYIKTYLLSKISGYQIEDNFTESFGELEVLGCGDLNEFGDLVFIDEVPKALRIWHSWILKADDLIYSAISRGLLETMDKMVSEGSEYKINILKLYFSLLRTCRIKTVLSIVNNTNTVLNPSLVKIIARNPRILRQIGEKNFIGPTGRGFYVQGASKMIFIGSSGEGDLLKFEIYDGSRRISHLTKICYNISLRSPQVLSGDNFAYNEFWTHLHKQFLYLRKFGGPEYGKLQACVKLGHIYALEIPKMFIEQAATIWITRVALEKTFKTSKLGRSKGKSSEENGKKAIVEIDLSQLKINPRSDSCVDETISSDRVTQSLQSVLDSAATATTTENNSEEEEKTRPTSRKSSRAFGKMSTAFEAAVEEEVALKFLKMGQFKKETNLNVTLSCYNESTNANTCLSLLYDEQNQLKSIGQRGLRWAVVDALSYVDLSARVLITSQNARTENLQSSIFSNGGIVERDQNGQMRVKEDFRTNQTIYARLQEGYSAVLRDDFTLIIRKIAEAAGVDPETGLFAITQDKWEVEAKMVLDWDEIHDYQYRDQLILTLWSILRKLNRPF